MHDKSRDKALKEGGLPRIMGIDPGSQKSGIAYIASKTLYPFSPRGFQVNRCFYFELEGECFV